MSPRSYPALLLLACASCSEVTRVPNDTAGGGGGAEQLEGNISVSVVDRGVPIADLDILVHGPSGELRGRFVSEDRPILVYADPGDSVGVVWQDTDRADVPNLYFRLDSVRVVAEMPAITLSIETRLENAPLNPPIRIEATVAEPEGVTERWVWLPCDIGGSVPRGAPYVKDDYRGCPWSTESTIIVTGHDADGRLATFDSAVVAHDGPAEVTLEFPMTPTQVRTASLTASWSTVAVASFEGASWWGLEDFFDAKSSTIFTASTPTAPTTFDFVALTSAPSATHVSLRAFLGDDWCDSALIHATTDDSATWIVDRLAPPVVDRDTQAWWLADQGERGDAVVVDRLQRTSLMRWIEPPPSTAERFPIVFPELPPDLADHFLPDDGGPDYEIFVEDRKSAEGYSAYVAEGAGARRLIDAGKPFIDGEARGRDSCKGRY